MESSGSTFAVKKPGRSIVVEPIVFFYAFFNFPLQLISQLYILAAIRNGMISKYGMMNITDHANITIDLCHMNASDPLVLFNGEVQKNATYFSLIISICSSLPALFVSLFLGSYSDKAGRKYAMLPPLIASLLNTGVFFLVVMMNLSMWYLIIGAFLNGLGGFYNTLLLGCFAYISDTTPPDKRRFRITVLELSLIMPGILSPLGAGQLIDVIGFGYLLTIALVGQAIIVFYVIFFVPETIQKDSSVKFFELSHMKKFKDLFTSKDDTSRNRKLLILVIVFAVCVIPMLDIGLETLFLKNRPLCMNNAMVGYYLSTFLAASTIGGIIAARLMKFCLSDQAVALVAGVAAVLYNVYKASVQNVIMMFLSPLFTMFSMLFIPSLKTLMSNIVGESEQGVMFGVIAFVELLCYIIGVAIFNPIYASTQNLMTGFVFIVMAMFYFVGCCVLVAYLIIYRHENKPVTVDVLGTEREPLLEKTIDQEPSVDNQQRLNVT